MTWLARLSDTYDQLADSEEEKLIPGQSYTSERTYQYSRKPRR